jgi:hypothetical protein
VDVAPYDVPLPSSVPPCCHILVIERTQTTALLLDSNRSLDIYPMSLLAPRIPPLRVAMLIRSNHHMARHWSGHIDERNAAPQPRPMRARSPALAVAGALRSMRGVDGQGIAAHVDKVEGSEGGDGAADYEEDDFDAGTISGERDEWCHMCLPRP